MSHVLGLVVFQWSDRTQYFSALSDKGLNTSMRYFTLMKRRQFIAVRPSEDGTSAHNTPSDRDPSRVTAMGSEASLKPASEHIAENATNEERPKPGKIPSTELHLSGYILLWYWSILAWPFPLGSSPVPCPSVLSPQ